MTDLLTALRCRQHADQAQPLAPVNTPGPGRGNKTGSDSTRLARGETQAYLLRRLACQLDDLLHQALQVAAQLEATGVRDGIQGLALRECSAQLEAAAGWATGVRLHVGFTP